MKVMTLHEYLLSLDKKQRELFAKSVGRSLKYLWKVARSKKQICGPKLAIKIEEETNGLIPKTLTRPDYFETEAA